MSTLVRPGTVEDAQACVEIYRPYVLDTPITFETEVPTIEEMAARITAARASHEWLVLEVDDRVCGYAYASEFNSREAYQWSVEMSVYLAQDCEISGGGRRLYDDLLQRLAERGYRRAFACIVQPNEGSDALHASFGFRQVGDFQRAGWKLGSWHDVHWWQYDLKDGEDDTDPPVEIWVTPRR